MINKKILIIFYLFVTCISSLHGEMINRYGTTTASFLEIGVGSGSAMGEAYVAVANDISSIYWNPAGLANVTRPSAMFIMQPWIVDIDMLFLGGAFPLQVLVRLGWVLPKLIMVTWM